MYTFITVLIAITCILLVAVVLVQNSKGGGLAAGFSSSNQVMGVQKTGDIVEKVTWGLAVALIALSLLSNFALPSGDSKGNGSLIQEEIDNATLPKDQGMPMPQQPAAPAQPKE